MDMSLLPKWLKMFENNYFLWLNFNVPFANMNGISMESLEVLNTK
jgi:hypothetical protein